MTATSSLDYAIPGIARFRIHVPGAGAVRTALINSKFAALAAPAPAGAPADVEMTIGPFTPDQPKECRVIDKDFWIAPNYLWFRGDHGRGATEITGMDGGPIRIRHVPYAESGANWLSRGLRGINMYLEPLLAWCLRQRGARLLHAGAVGVGDGAFLVCGANGAGKTRLILEWCLRHGGAFLGDDLVVVRDDGTVAPMPEHVAVLAHRAAAVAAGRKPSVNHPALLWQLGRGRPPAPPAGLRLGGAAPLAGVLLVESVPGAAEAYRLLPATPEHVWHAALRLEQLEWVKNQRRHRQVANVSRFLMAYEYAFPGSRIFAALLEMDPLPPAPAFLGRLPAWKLELGKTWSREAAAGTAAAAAGTGKK